MRRRIATLVVALALSACSTLGTPASAPGILPHGGTGQFRALAAPETMLGASPAGVTLMSAGRAVDDAMAFQGDLFYASASFRPAPDAGPPDAGPPDAAVPDDSGTTDDASLPRDAAISRDAGPSDTGADAGPIAPASVDWSRFLGRQIFRSHIGDAWGFAAGDVVFSASESWQGDYVTDPWVVQRPDGRFLLYYAAAGGIGVASASSVDGPWTREGTGPLLPTTSEGTPSRPSAIATAGLEGAPDAMLLYYELADSIRVASSPDGITLHDLGAIATTPLDQRDDRDGFETSVGAPGAISVPTPAGRHVVRIYYESRRTNGTVLIGLLGSGDGVHFDQFGFPMFAERDRQRPAPRYVDDRTTLVYTWVPSSVTGAEIASVTPAGVRLNRVPPTTF